MYERARDAGADRSFFDLKATPPPTPVSRMEFQEKRFIRRPSSLSLARRLERFVGGQLINKSWKEGRERKGGRAGRQASIRERRGRRTAVRDDVDGKRGVGEREGSI